MAKGLKVPGKRPAKFKLPQPKKAKGNPANKRQSTDHMNKK